MSTDTGLSYETVEARSRAIAIAVAEVTPFCESWLADLRSVGGALLKDVRRLSTMTGIKAAQFAKTGAAFADWQPGNSTSYKAVLYDLRRPQEAALREAGRDPAEAAVKYIGPEYSYGGRLLVSLPEQNRCAALALIDCYHPTFVAEHLGFKSVGDSIPFAILLTLFGAQVGAWLAVEAAPDAEHSEPERADMSGSTPGVER